MNSVSRDIFRAIYEGKWLSIEYKNKDERITKYWIGIKNVNPVEKILIVDGLHLGYMTVRELNRIFVDSIISSSVVEGSYYEINKKLVDDIYLNPHKYVNLFENTANLHILNYLELCNKNDTTPYYSEFELVKYLDRDTIKNNKYMLTDEQFKYIVNNFQYKSVNKIKQTRIQKLAMNVLSIHTDKGLYVLAYKELELDIKNRMLIASDEISICYEFNIDEYRQSIRRFLDADDFVL